MIRFQSNTAFFRRELMRAANSERYAIVSALNAAAYDISQKDMKRVMKRVFDRPTPFTLRAFQYFKATAEDLTATVDYRYGSKGSRFGRRHYLVTQVEGGARPPKAVETKLANRARALGFANFPRTLYPTAAVPRDRYGNVTPGFWNRMLSALGAQTEQGYAANRTARSARRNKRYRTERFFFAGAGRSSHLQPGVWLARQGRVFPVMLGSSGAGYSRRFPAFETVVRAARRRFPVYLARAQERIAARFKAAA